MWRRGIRVFVFLSLRSENDWAKRVRGADSCHLCCLFFFLSLPFIRWGLCELAWLAEQLQMWDTIHTARFQSNESSEFRTFIFFNYVNHMPQIFPIKSWGRAFFFSLGEFSMRLPREAGRGNNTGIVRYKTKSSLDSLSLTFRAGNNKWSCSSIL